MDQDQTASTEIVQTMTRKAFDPETVSVTVGPHPNDSRTIWVRIRDEAKKVEHEFNVLETHTIADISAFIHATAVKLGLEASSDPSNVAKAISLQNAAAAGLTEEDLEKSNPVLATGAVGNALAPANATTANVGLVGTASTTDATGPAPQLPADAAGSLTSTEQAGSIASNTAPASTTQEPGLNDPQPAPVGGEAAPATGNVSAGSAQGGTIGDQA